MRVMESGGERWGAADEASLAHPLLTSCRVARFLTGCGPEPVRSPGVCDPRYKLCGIQCGITGGHCGVLGGTMDPGSLMLSRGHGGFQDSAVGFRMVLWRQQGIVGAH